MTEVKDINWDYGNYPPFINQFHYDLNELNEEQLFIAKNQRIHYFFVLGICGFNLLSNIIIVSTGNGLDYYILGSVLLLIGIFLFGAFLHIQTFFAVGTCSKRQMIIALVAQGIMLAASVIFAFVGAGNLEGLGGIPIALAMSIPGWSVTAVVIESLLWMVSAAAQGFLMWKMYQFYTVGLGHKKMHSNRSMAGVGADLKSAATASVIKNLVL